MNLNREQLLIIVLGVIILLVGSGVFFWQFNRNQQVVTDIKEPVKISKAKNRDSSVEKSVKKKEKKDLPATIIVHVAGAVKNAGVYQLKEGARVIDALKLAGGETGRADLDSINLAAFIYDGEKIYIPVKGNGGEKEVNVVNSNVSKGKISINRADKKELQKLSGIGPSKAESIIDYREKINGFTKIDQLLEVSGIGEKTLAKIKDELILR